MPKTLVVDDDPATEPMFRDYAESMTEVMETEFLFAASDLEAAAALSSRRDLDMAIVAIDSETLSGMALFHTLDPEAARVPRIAMSRHRDVDDLRQALRDGAADLLFKPVDARDLTLTLHRVYRECARRRDTWKTEAELAAIRREIEIAGELQRRILPERFPVVGGLDAFARTVPARDMGGDFYDVFELKGGKLGLVIADVAGKGIPAAFYMAVARTLIRATALPDAEPGRCLEQVNGLLCRHDIPGMFVSVFYGVLDPAAWQLRFANGGHPPPLVVGAGGAGPRPLHGGEGTVLGIDEAQVYAEGSLTLEAGEGVFFYTDGLTEAQDAARQAFGEERLARSLAAHAKGSASDLVGAAAAIAEFVGDAPQHDDITSLVVKRAG